MEIEKTDDNFSERKSLKERYNTKVLIDNKEHIATGICHIKEPSSNEIEFTNKNGYTVQFIESNELKNTVYDKILEWYKKHNAFHAETIMQYDNTLIEAPELLSEIVELFKFKYID